jgi:hypothetical protein
MPTNRDRRSVRPLALATATTLAVASGAAIAAKDPRPAVPHLTPAIAAANSVPRADLRNEARASRSVIARRALTRGRILAAQRARALARKQAAAAARERAAAAPAVTTASAYGFPAVWLRVAQCESGLRWTLNAEYDGGLQFAPSTWLAYHGGRFAPYAYEASPAEQVEVAQEVLATSGPGQWPICGPEAGLTRENGA